MCIFFSDYFGLFWVHDSILWLKAYCEDACLWRMDIFRFMRFNKRRTGLLNLKRRWFSISRICMQEFDCFWSLFGEEFRFSSFSKQQKWMNLGEEFLCVFPIRPGETGDFWAFLKERSEYLIGKLIYDEVFLENSGMISFR
jgi:hypothetical protein